MQTNLAPEFKNTPDGNAAEAILRKCVHCGFCTATCPTYQLLGNELDGPRGRIYLMKQVLEGMQPTRETILVAKLSMLKLNVLHPKKPFAGL
ncbi:MAG: Lactate utilization protein [Pseudomonadota bacterium]